MLFQYVSSAFQYPKQLKVSAQKKGNTMSRSQILVASIFGRKAKLIQIKFEDISRFKEHK
jgi:hypothetical protein